MSTSLVILTAFAVASVFLTCDAIDTDRDKTEDLPYLKSLIGYKPCLDDDCETRGPSQLNTNGTKITYVPQDRPAPIPGKTEDPRVHCIFLRPSAVATFKELEAVYPDISGIKYSILEDIIHYMHSFAELAFGDCEPDMKLLDLIIVAANALKEEYRLQGSKDCEYEEHLEKPSQGHKEPVMPTEKPYEPHVPSPTKKPYPISTEKPYEPHFTETKKAYVPSSTTKPYPSSTEKSYVPSSKQPPVEKPVSKPCPDVMTTEKPCQPDYVTEEYSNSEIVGIIAEHKEPEIPYVGSLRGIPGIHYPNYTDIPITSFTCADKKYIPGFYADLDTGCQVFHVCYEHRRESFLCPVGTTFNQPILACDYWYSSNCSWASSYYDVNEKTHLEEGKIDEEVEEILTSNFVKDENSGEASGTQSVDSDLEEIAPFFPVKAVVIDVEPEVKVPIVKPAVSDVEKVAAEIVDDMATMATKVISKARVVVKSIPEPVESKPVLKPAIPKKSLKLEQLLAKSVVPLAKAKLAAIPVSKVVSLKTAIPAASFAAKKVSIPIAAAKAKLVTKAAIPAVKAAVAAPVIAKAKMTAIPAAKLAVAAPVLAKAKMAAIPAAKVAVAAPIITKAKFAVPAVKMGAAKVAAKSSIPALKAKMIASAVPLAKTKIVPLMKVKSAGAPLLKAKMLALPLAKSKLAGPIPLAKVKLAKAAAISPLTKKALALGYMKLLKAKKLALMG